MSNHWYVPVPTWLPTAYLAAGVVSAGGILVWENRAGRDPIPVTWRLLVGAAAITLAWPYVITAEIRDHYESKRAMEQYRERRQEREQED